MTRSRGSRTLARPIETPATDPIIEILRCEPGTRSCRSVVEQKASRYLALSDRPFCSGRSTLQREGLRVLRIAVRDPTDGITQPFIDPGIQHRQTKLLVIDVFRQQQPPHSSRNTRGDRQKGNCAQCSTREFVSKNSPQVDCRASGTMSARQLAGWAFLPWHLNTSIWQPAPL